MATIRPEVSTIIHPVDGSSMVDHLAAIVLQKSTYVHPSVTHLNSTLLAQNNLGGNWTDGAKMLSSNGTQGDMAYTQDVGVTQILDFDGGSFGVDTSKIVTSVLLGGRAAHTPATSPGYIGDGKVRLTIGYQDRFLDSRTVPNARFTGTVDTAVLNFSWEARGYFEHMCGKDPYEMTVGDLEGIGTDFRLYVTVDENTKVYVNWWRVSDVSMKITYRDTDPGGRESAYQFEISKNSLFTTTAYDTTVVKRSADRHTVAPSTLESDTTYYVRARTFDAAGIASDWSSEAVNSFTTLSEAAAQLVHDPQADAVLIGELEFGRPFEGGAWAKQVNDEFGNPVSNVYKATFNRANEKTSNFWIVDFEEDGDRGNYTAKPTITAVDGTASSYYWKEGSTNKLYVHTSDGRCPTGFKNVGITAALAYPISTRSIVSGPGDVYTYEPRILQAPSITETIGDVVMARPTTPSGSLVLANYDKFFTSLFAVEAEPLQQRNTKRSLGWLGHNRRFRLRIVGTANGSIVPYAEALDIFDGVVLWPGGAMLKEPTLTLQVQPRMAKARYKSLAATKYGKGQYPDMLDREEGRPQQEVVGTGHERAYLAVVDTENRLLSPGLSVSAVSMIYVDGVALDTNSGHRGYWSYDATSGHVEFVNGNAAARTHFDDNVEGEWSCDCDGVTFEGSAAMTIGKLSRWLLIKAGTDEDDIDTGAFDYIDGLRVNTDIWSQAQDMFPIRFVVSEETKIVDLLMVAQSTGTFYVVYRPDGKVSAVPAIQSEYSQNTLVMMPYDVLDEPRFGMNTEAMASALRISYWGYPQPGQAIKDRITLSVWPKADYGIERELLMETFHARSTGPRMKGQAHISHSSFPERDIELKVGLRGWLCWPGTLVCLTLDEALDPTGSYEWDLLLVNQRIIHPDLSVTLRLRYQAAIEYSEGPF